MSTAKKISEKKVLTKAIANTATESVANAKAAHTPVTKKSAPSKRARSTAKTPAHKSSRVGVAQKSSSAKVTTTTNANTPHKSTSSAQAGKTAKSKPPTSPSKSVLKAKKVNDQVKLASKPKKNKVIRDSFTIPKDEYQTIIDLKMRSSKLGHGMKKSELIRAGIKVLSMLSDSAFTQAIAQIPMIKTGRPKTS
jgi:hypothetical protein